MVQTGYAPVNGLEMYYEIHGIGKLLIALHGAYMTIEAMFTNAFLAAAAASSSSH